VGRKLHNQATHFAAGCNPATLSAWDNKARPYCPSRHGRQQAPQLAIRPASDTFATHNAECLTSLPCPNWDNKVRCYCPSCNLVCGRWQSVSQAGEGNAFL
jgi:hypothetical protein